MPDIAPSPQTQPLRAKSPAAKDTHVTYSRVSDVYECESTAVDRPLSPLDHAVLLSATCQNSGSYDKRNLVAQTSAIGANALISGLYTGSSYLSEDALTFFMIAYSHEGTELLIRDPDLDTKYLSELFSQLHDIHFSALSGTAATLSRIDTEFQLLWDRADENTHIFVLLTGHGVDNAMVLHDNERIDESYIAGMVENLPPKNLQVTVAFDICRENLEKTAIRMNRQVNLVWSCSIGQQASALEFGSLRMPSSFFLIGFFMASWDVYQNPGGTLEYYLQVRVTQLARLNNHTSHRQLCESCLAGMTCSEAFKMRSKYSQDVDFRQAKNALSKLCLLLTARSQFIELAKETHEFMMANNPFLRSNNTELAPRFS